MNITKRHLISTFLAIAVGLVAATPFISRAIPYASTISESGGTVTFYLNETADNVKVVFTGPSSTLDLGARTRGSHTFPRGGAASYQIQVTKSAPPLWTQISDDTNSLIQFFAPISLSVNKNPASTNFGRIYVLEDGGGVSGGRTTTEGIFVLNPDITDAFAQGNNGLQAGLSSINIWAATGTSDRYDPFQIEVGDDDYVYISDANDPRGAVVRADATVTTGEAVLEGIGNTAAPTIHTVVYGLHTKGSLATSNLTVWGTDGQWQSVTAANSVLRWDIGAGPLPYNTPPVVAASPGPATSERDSDLDVAPDGNIFVAVSFDTGTGPTGVPTVQEFSSTGTLLWSSVIGGVDVFTNSYSLEVSPDNTKLAIIRRDRQTWIVGLTNGPNGRVIDLSTTNLLATFTVGAGNGRSVAWDRAGNLYVGNRSTERVRIFSPGGTTTALTGSDGSFNITVPNNTASITNAVSSISESNATPLTFTVNRAGATAQPLTVSFLFTGTASNGVDHSTFPTSITFPAGVTSSNISVTLINDGIAELTETLTVAVNSGTNYGAGTPASATVNILDDETPEIGFVAATPPKLLESYAPSKVTLSLERRGRLTDAVTANISWSGAAVRGADFSGPLSVAFGSGVVTTNVTLTPLNDQAYEGDELATGSVAAGTGYNPGAGTASALVVDDEYPPGAVLFSDDFNSINSSNLWRVNLFDPTTDFIDWNWDYSTVGVPIAPGTTDGSTKGLRFRCGNAVLQLDGLSVSPTNGNFSGNYRLRFDMWINYNGPMPDGGPGSTQNFDAGVGTTGDHPVWRNDASSDGVWVTCTGDGADGNTGGDYTAYIGTALQNDDTGFYAAGTAAVNSGIRNGSHPYYAFWGGHTAPAAQVLLYPNQSGVANIGNAGMAWHTVVLTKVTNVVTWAIDGITIATVTNDLAPFSTNVFVGYQDLFASGVVSDNPELSFGLVDNLRVESFVATPTLISITSIKVIGTSVEVTFTASASDLPGSFKLQRAALVTGTYADDNTAIITSLGGGAFKATTTVSSGAQFFRIKQ